MSNNSSALDATLSLRVSSDTKKALESISSALGTDSGGLVRAILESFLSSGRRKMLFFLRSLTTGKNKDSSLPLLEILSAARGFSKGYLSDTSLDLSFLDQEK